MNKKNKNIILIICFIIIMCSSIYVFYKKSSNIFQDDILFFKFFSSSNSANRSSVITADTTKDDEDVKQLLFDVSYKNVIFKNINLMDSVNHKTLVNEKIAPGSKGCFNIKLNTNMNVNYKIKFKSKNAKPSNLVFKFRESKNSYNTLEEMEKELEGRLEANSSKSIYIEWKWEYEKNNIEDKKDTLDGIKLKEYNFEIYTMGY